MSTYALGVRRPFNGRSFLLLGVLVALGMLALVPIALRSPAAPPDSAMPVPAIITLALGLGIALYGALAAAGLWLGGRIGLGAPILDGWSKGESVGQRIKAMLGPALLCGVIGVAVILAMDVFVFAPFIHQTETEALAPPAWIGFFLSVHAGVVEEVLFRLFALTFLAWLGSRLSATAEGRPTALVFWTANLLAALLFGLAHLPTAAAMGMTLDAPVVIRTVALNGFLGLTFGWLYRRYGIESAMLAHTTFDVLVYGIIPLLTGG